MTHAVYTLRNNTGTTSLSPLIQLNCEKPRKRMSRWFCLFSLKKIWLPPRSTAKGSTNSGDISGWLSDAEWPPNGGGGIEKCFEGMVFAMRVHGKMIFFFFCIKGSLFITLRCLLSYFAPISPPCHVMVFFFYLLPCFFNCNE